MTMVRRAALDEALAEQRARLVDALGGEQAISPQEEMILDSVLKTWLLLSSIDAWLFSMRRQRRQVIVDKAEKRLFPVVLQRMHLERDLRAALKDLGLKRRSARLDLARELMVRRSP